MHQSEINIEWLDGINSCSWYHCLPIGIYHWLGEGYYSSCMRSSLLHGSKTWPDRKENEVALQWAGMRMVRWMCNAKVKDWVPSKELREKRGIDDIILILQQNRLQCYGHVLQKTMIGWRNVWNMRWRAPDQEVDQWGCGQRLCKKIAKHVIWTGRMLWTVVDGRSW